MSSGAGSGQGDGRREHLFISYAWEDGALAEWLTLKLTAEGYRVWCDRFKILGGEKWPDDVDAAIRADTFRMLHLVSAFSLSKPNPKKERELALALERERGSEILIPLNVDGTKPSDLPWRIVDVAFIPFVNWSAGFAQLLKKLESIHAPRPRLESGRSIAASAFLKFNPLEDAPEEVISNLHPFISIPATIRHLRFDRAIAREEASEIHKYWAFRNLGGKEALAFTPPTKQVAERIAATEIAQTEWREGEMVYGVLAEHLVSELLSKSLEVHCHSRGLTREPHGRGFYFPMGLLPHNKLAFRNYSSRETGLKVSGYRSFRGSKYRYHLGPSFQVKHLGKQRFIMRLRVRLHLEDEHGGALSARALVARRKNIGRSWWNKQWLDRQVALMHFLSDGQNTIAIGDAASSVILSTRPVVGSVDRAINEGLLDNVGAPDAVPPPTEDEPKEDD